MLRNIFLFIAIISVSCTTNYHIKKGNQALSVYNYFEAQKQYSKALKKDHFKAHYGLAAMYYRNDNPFHNLEHAYYHLNQADSAFQRLDLQKRKYKDLDSSAWMHTMDSLMQNIATAEFIHVQIIDQQELYQRFINKFPNANEKNKAIQRRDQLALEKTYEIGTADAFLTFLKTYPESQYYEEAKRQYEQNLYNEKTKNQSILSYVRFIRNYPESPYIDDAEEKIYHIETEYENLQSYQSFIETYPNNHMVNEAWKKLFGLYMKDDYSKSRLETFAKEYPDYPFKDELEETLLLAELQLLPFERQRKWGYIDTEGEIVIQAEFDWVEPFSEGLALVGKDDQIGYINKRGKWQITNIDDGMAMTGGVAVFEIDGAYGLIDRSGNFVLEPKYEDIGPYSDGLLYVLKQEKYGYLDNNGVQMIPCKYDYAGDFEDGIAQVQLEGLWGIIDKKGSFLIRPKYDKLQKFNDTSYIVEQNGSQGVLSLKEDTIVPFDYELIDAESEHRALVQKEGLIGYFNVKNQKLEIDCEFEPFMAMSTLGDFVNYHAAVQMKGKIGFIDTTGKKVVPTIFKSVGYFSDRIPIIKEEFWGYCDEEADLKIDYEYNIASSFVGENAIVQIDPFFGLIDKEGEKLLEIKYEALERIDSNLFIVKEKGRFGLRTIQNEILPTTYNKYVTIEDRYIRFDKNDAFVYFDSETKEVIESE